MEVVRSIADRVAVLARGKVVETGTVFDMFADPQSDTGRNFVSTVLRHDPTEQDLVQIARSYSGTIVSVQIRDGVRIGPLIAQAARHGVGFEVVHGEVGNLQAQTFGNLSLALDGPAERVAELVAELQSTTRTVVRKGEG
jgi:D-methionine transport system ATP-binding protein